MGAVLITADAASADTIEWHAIQWRKVNQTVHRLQTRIVKTLQAGNHRKVRALQRLLARSFSGSALAVKRVTENRGKRTAGVDKEVWETPRKKAKAIHRIRRSRYKAKPLRRVMIPKTSGKGYRGLHIPTMLDRAKQALHLLTLDPIAETQADPNSYGFRRERSTADAIQMGFIVLSGRYAPQWVLKCDIQSCFDKINHQWLLDHIPMDKQVLTQWLKAGYIDQGTLHRTERGTPQGGVASPTLLNMALDGLESWLKTHFKRCKISVIRYADDICITGNSTALLTEAVRPLVAQFLSERGLTLSPEKTQVVSIHEGFDFLGTNVRKYGGKLLIKPSKKSVKSVLNKIRKIIARNKQAKTENLIRLLNPIIGGWARYYQHTVSKATFSTIDHQIWKRLWQWAKRRHPDKRKAWVWKRYFLPHDKSGRQSVFACVTETGQTLYLAIMNTFPIQRHVKIRGQVNPYDPQDESYFEERQMKQWLKGQKGTGKIRRLGLKQHGLCPECRTQITQESGFNIHHRVYRVQGGSDCASNLLLLHPNCHRRLHANDSMKLSGHAIRQRP